MIKLTRLNGSQMWMNADLIASIEQRPDTTVTLVDGRHLVVQETPADVVAELAQFRASILALAEQLLRRSEAGTELSAGTDGKIYLLPSPSDVERG